MSVASNAVKKRKKSESKPQAQINKCLNEKRRREQENIYIEELAELISASTSDMSSLSVKPDKCAILQETVNQIRLDKQRKPEQSDDLQQSEVSSSKPTILTNDVYGPLLLEALEGFLFVVNIDGKVEFVSENISTFLKYTQEEIVEKSIYNIILANDRGLFSRNLLPMMSIGNGRSWSEANSNSAGKSKSFNCRFLIKSSEEVIMDKKQVSHNQQFENMQVSAMLFPFSSDANEIDGVNEQQNRLACVARRIPANEKSPMSLGVEQFNTRMDRTGKVLDIDTSGVSSSYSHYLNKELVGCAIFDLCHPSDVNKLKQHLKETLELGSNTSSVYKLQVSNDCFVRVQTKSRKFKSNQSASEQVIVSTHSIIRNADSPVPSILDGNQSIPSPNISNAGPTVSSVNGSASLTSLSYETLPSLSPSDNDYAPYAGLLDMLPSSSWLDQNSSHSKDSDSATVTNILASSPQTASSNRSSDLGSGMHVTNSAFSPGIMSSRSGSSNPSPSIPGRAPTPYGSSVSCFSPFTQSSNGKTSPPCVILPNKSDAMTSSSAELHNMNSLSQTVNSLSEVVNSLSQGASSVNQNVNNLNQVPNSLSQTVTRVSPTMSSFSQTVNRLSPNMNSLNHVPNSLSHGVNNSNQVLNSLSSHGGNNSNQGVNNLNQNSLNQTLSNIGHFTNNLSQVLSNLNNSVHQERQYNLKDHQKLRNLLTQNNEDVHNRTMARQVSQEEVTIVNESRPFEGPPQTRPRPNVRDSSVQPCSSSDAILRDLLNGEDDEVPVEPIMRTMEGQVPPSFATSVSCKATDSSQQRLGNNDMLRELLNKDDGDRNYRKSQDLVNKFLSAGPSDKFPIDRYKTDLPTHSRIPDNSVPKQASIQVNRTMPDVTGLSDPMALKRKSLERSPAPNSLPKRQNTAGLHAQLAGQNPMLVSMLEQTPRTPPTVPPSVANTIMTQLPQERLPKNLEKKLVHTPCTTAAANCTSIATQVFSSSLPSTASVQQDIVTQDARGHILQQHQMGIQAGLNRPSYSQPQQLILDKILSGTDDNLLIARSLALGLTSASSLQNPPVFVQQAAQNNLEGAGTASLVDILNDAGLMDVDSLSDSIQTTQASDPGFAEILEQIYSLQEDLNVETTPQRDDRGAILKILSDVIDPPQISVVSRPVTNTTNTVHDISEKIAISAIQKQLMSYEGSSLSVTSRTGNVQNSSVVPTYSQAGRSSTQVSGTSVAQAQLSSDIALLQQQQQISAGSLPPNYNSSLVANRVRLPVNSPVYAQNNRDLIANAQRRGLQIVRNTYIGLGGANVNQIRKSLIERKQRAYLQQQQKRLIEQQQKQQLTMQTKQPLDGISSSGATPFPENMSDLLNTVAPNVTLQRSASIPETQAPTHFNTTLAVNPLPSPVAHTSTTAQLSPGQRRNTQSPFSSLSQQQFQNQASPPGNFQQPQLSPHPPPSYPQGRSSHSPSPNPTSGSRSPHMVLSPQQATSPQQWPVRPATSQVANLQLQNPMLNAQLSQASLNATQNRLAAQQRQQLVMRSMSSPNSIQISRNSSFTSPTDGSNYSPLSPAAVSQNQPQTQQQQQQQQQRIQRTISLPIRTTATQSSNSGNYVSTEPVMSPQPLASPSFSQSIPTSSAGFASLPSPNMPTTYSLSPGGQHFNFDRQNVHIFTSSASDGLRAVNNQVASDYVRQGLRAVVGARTQQLITSQNQIQQSMNSAPLTTAAAPVNRMLNVYSLSRETLEELGLSMELLQGTDQQPNQQAHYSQGLLGANNIDPSNQPGTSSPRVEEPKPADQKKSLLQQLLSEPP